jgi:maltose/moltooligosaccharide transporter
MKKQALALGVGFFAVQAVWTSYNAFMPLFYRQFTSNLALVGLFMTFDNILALTLQPWWGARSDLTRTMLGRRMPFVIVGMPIAAVFVLLLPFFSNISLGVLIAAALVMNVSMTTFRAPLAALFSDLFPRAVRTQVSGATDVLAGLGAIVALLVGGELYDIDRAYPFILVAALLVVAVVVLRLGIREPPIPADESPHDGDLPPQIVAAVRALLKLPNKSPMLFIIGFFFVFTAWNGLESFWTTYATTALGMKGGDAANFAAILALSYLVGAFPAGMAAARFGRQRTIQAGMLLLIPLYLLCALNRTELAFAVLLGVMGICWSLVLVNGIILFQEFASPRQVGLFTGLYAIGTAAAQIVGPPSYGALMNQFGPQALWFAALVSLAVGLAFINRVREGQVALTS